MGLAKITLKAPGGGKVTVKVDNVPDGWSDAQIAEAVRARVPDIERTSGVSLIAPVAVGLGAAGASQDSEAGPISKGGRTMIEAWHGSPHKFDRFDMSKIGTGEGAQAYGHGLYFADVPGVAKDYRRTTSFQDAKRSFLDVLPEDAEIDDVLDMLDEGEFTPEQARVISALADEDWLGFDYPSQAISAAYTGQFDRYDIGPELQEAIENQGALYRVHIDVDPDTLLDWDKPVSEQPDAFKRLITRGDTGEIDPRYQNFTVGDWLNSATLDFGGRKQVSDWLRENGINGIRYRDAMSRDGSPDSTYNYVIFDDNPISIQERGYATPEVLTGLAGLSAAAPGTVGYAQQGLQGISEVIEGMARGFGGSLLGGFTGLTGAVANYLGLPGAVGAEPLQPGSLVRGVQDWAMEGYQPSAAGERVMGDVRDVSDTLLPPAAVDAYLEGTKPAASWAVDQMIESGADPRLIGVTGAAIEGGELLFP